MRAEELNPNVTISGPLFPEPVQVIVALPMGASVKLVGKGTRSNTVYEPILTADQLALLTASPAQEPFDGDAGKFRLGIEAMRLGLAYEYDPYFSPTGAYSIWSRRCRIRAHINGRLGSDVAGDVGRRLGHRCLLANRY